MKILILCTGNSCRSQMAEGWLKSFDNSLEVYSAGTKPANSVNPNSVIVMNEVGVSLDDQKPEHVDKFADMSFDYVVSVCDNARELCPVFTGEVKHNLHHSFDDPYDATGTEEEILNVYRRVRDEIKEWFYKLYKERMIYIKPSSKQYRNT